MKLILITSLILSSVSANAYQAFRTVEITHDNTMVFAEKVDFANMDLLIYASIAKRSKLPISQTFYILLISGGGNYDAAKYFRGVASKLPNTEIICRYCASAAGYMFTGTKPLKRLAYADSVMLMHEMYNDHVTAADLKADTLKDLQKNSDEFNKVIYTELGMSKQEYDLRILNTEWIVSGKELVRLHLADEFVKLHCDPVMYKFIPQTCRDTDQ